MTRHATDYLSFTFGLLFAAVAAVLLFADAATISWEWVLPVAVIGVGAAVILAARPRREATPNSDGF